jgi:hypothetical protein
MLEVRERKRCKMTNSAAIARGTSNTNFGKFIGSTEAVGEITIPTSGADMTTIQARPSIFFSLTIPKSY